MAITLLSTGITTISLSTTVSSVVAAVPLVGGSNRMLVVAVGTETFAINQVLPTVSYGGIPLQLLQRRDGALASRVQRAGTFIDEVGVSFWALREVDLLAAAHTQLEVDWQATSSASNGRQFMAGYWLLGNCDQSQIVRDFKRFNGLTGTVLGGTLDPGGTSDAIIVAGINNTNAGTIQITIDGVGLAENFDSAMTTACRFAGANDLTAASVAGIPFDMTFTQQANPLLAANVIIGVRLAEHFPYGGSVALLDEPDGSVTLEAL